MKLATLLLLLFALRADAQKATYALNAKGDTLNMTTTKGLKQGKWIERIEDNMGEPGYQAEGKYKLNEREGKWLLYSLMGDPAGEENYSYGQKNGKQIYYNIRGNLTHEESWKAITPDNMYDTVTVPDWKKDPSGYTTKLVVVKLMGNALRHGKWSYYDDNGRLIRAETYILDKLSETTVIAYDPSTNKVISKEQLRYDIETGKAVAKAGYERPKVPTKPKEVLEFEKLKKGKKTKKFTDGSTGN